MQTLLPSPRWPWIMLSARLVLFFCFQAVLAGLFALFGQASPWAASAAWWSITIIFANLACLAALIGLFRAEGCRFWDLFHIDRQHIKGDLLLMLALLVIAGPVSMLPNQLLGSALYGDPLAPSRLFFSPLPRWAVYLAMVFFPLTQGLTELPTYFGYVMPRLSALTGRPWLGYTLASLFLGLQHMTLPLRFDPRFMAWRALMYLPFAFFIGLVIWKRPRLLPFFAIVHVLIDFASTLMYLMPF